MVAVAIGSVGWVPHHDWWLSISTNINHFDLDNGHSVFLGGDVEGRGHKPQVYLAFSVR